MGDFLAIGLVNRIYVKRKEVDGAQITLDRLQERMKQDFYYSPDIYTMNEHDDTYHVFTLKEDVLHEQLVPLLETLYPLLYERSVYYDDVLQELRTLPSSEWISWAEEKPSEVFQYSNRDRSDYIQENHRDIRLYYESILLSLEGKIAMEVYGRQFNFMKYLMIQTFQQFSLARALRIYITG